MHMEDEILDIVNKNDEVIGQQPRSTLYQQNASNFRVVNLFLVNENGELWIPKRTAHKRMFPLSLDASMGGHVESGESYETALKRETHEELNLTIEETDYKLLGHLFPHIHHVSAFMKVYELKTNNAPHYNPDDYCAAHWMRPSEVLSMINKGAACKDDLPKMIQLFYTQNAIEE